MKNVNEVSKLTGVSRRTLQYYDDEEIVKTERSNNNYRLYDERALVQLWKVLIYKKMGFDLQEIRRLLFVSESEKNEFLELQMRNIKNNIETLSRQMKFIALVLEKGIPEMPEEETEITFVNRIAELWEKEKNEL